MQPQEHNSGQLFCSYSGILSGKVLVLYKPLVHSFCDTLKEKQIIVIADPNPTQHKTFLGCTQENRNQSDRNVIK